MIKEEGEYYEKDGDEAEDLSRTNDGVRLNGTFSRMRLCRRFLWRELVLGSERWEAVHFRRSGQYGKEYFK